MAKNGHFSRHCATSRTVAAKMAVLAILAAKWQISVRTKSWLHPLGRLERVSSFSARIGCLFSQKKRTPVLIGLRGAVSSAVCCKYSAWIWFLAIFGPKKRPINRFWPKWAKMGYLWPILGPFWPKAANRLLFGPKNRPKMTKKPPKICHFGNFSKNGSFLGRFLEPKATY